MFGLGSPGPFRLFSVSLGGQIAWLLPLALLGMIALAWQRRPRLQEDWQQQSLVLWGIWLLTMAIFFSVASFFHQYYLTEMAPAVSALFGIGLVTMWRDYRRSGWRGWLLPLALVATAAVQVYVLAAYPSWSRWMTPLIVGLCALAVIVLIVARLRPTISEGMRGARYLVPALSVGVLALLIAPTVWASFSVIQNVEAQIPTAGPSQEGGFRGFGGGGGNAGDRNNTRADAALVSYLEAHQGNAKFLVATPSSMSADSLILTTNRPVMAMGGFSGGDPILTTNQLASLVSNGTVRFFLLNGSRAGQATPRQILEEIPAQDRDLLRNGFPGGGFGQNSLSTWVTNHCTAVPASQWQSGATGSSNDGFGVGSLYDCAKTH
jgi:4-amino-4-deoxy-L-arabinose transferase-like glycosyltransferase